MKQTIKIATRDSELAMWQTNWVAAEIHEKYPDLKIEILPVKTLGDKILDSPLSKIGDKGLFTKELDRALIDNHADLAVHSMKDVPTAIPQELEIATITKRHDPGDVVFLKKVKTLNDLPKGATIATGSLRRKAQLKYFRPDLNIIDLRGNLNTRWKKYEAADWDGMILARAGVERLGWGDRITQVIPSEIMLPAVGQGTLAIITRKQDSRVQAFLKHMDHFETRWSVLAERAFLRRLEGGCQVPIGALGQISGDQLRFEGCVADLDGTQLLRKSLSGRPEEAESLGVQLAETLLKDGADKILETIIRNSR